MRFFSSKRLVRWILCVSLMPVAVSAQSPVWAAPFPIRDDRADRLKAGEMLERVHQLVLSSCGNLPRFRERRLGNDRDLSRIPQFIQLAVDLEDSVRRVRPSSLARAFSYVAPAGRDPLTLANPLNSRHLDLDPLMDPALMIPVGDNRLVYVNSCRSIGSAAADAGINVSGFVAAAANAMANVATNQSVAVTAGRFVSPFDELLQSTGSTAVYGRLIAWDWYRRNSNALTTGGTYRRSLSGYATARLLTREMDASLRASVEGRTGLLAFASLRGQAQASIIRSEGAEVVVYSLWESIPSVDSGELAALPQPATLSKEIEALLVPVVERASDRVVQTLDFLHSVRLDGLPRRFCSNGMLRLAGPQSEFLSAQFTIIEPVGNSVPWVTCSVRVSYSAPDSLWRSDEPRNVVLQYRFAHTIRSGSDSAILSVPVAVPVRLVAHPRIELASAPVRQVDSAGAGAYTTVKWSGYRFIVADDDNPVNWIAFGRGAIAGSASCRGVAGGREEFALTASDPRTDEGLAGVAIDWSMPFPARATLESASARACELEAHATFRLQNGRVVRKQLPKVMITVPGVPAAVSTLDAASRP